MITVYIYIYIYIYLISKIIVIFQFQERFVTVLTTIISNRTLMSKCNRTTRNEWPFDKSLGKKQVIYSNLYKETLPLKFTRMVHTKPQFKVFL